MILIENNLRPMIRRNRKLFISMIIICMLGVMLMTAAVGSERSLRLSIERYIEEYQFQDITITTATAEQEDFSALNTIEDIDKIDLSYTEDVTFKRADGRILAGRLITRGADAFMRLDLVSKEEKSETLPNVYLDSYFAERNQLEVGSTISVDTNAGTIEANIAGFVLSPERLGVSRDEHTWFDHSDFGVLYAEYDDFCDGINRISVLLKEKDDAEKVCENIVAAIGSEKVLTAETYENSVLKREVDKNTQPLAAISVVLPIALFVIMLFFLYLFIGQIIRRNKSEIGILRALGFEVKEITQLYGAFMLPITLIGNILGMIFGWLLLTAINDVYQEMLLLPYCSSSFNILILLLVFILTVLVGQAAVYANIGSISGTKPAEAMRGNRGSVSKVPALVSFIFKKLPERFKLFLFAAFRNKLRYFISILCIVLTMFLIFTSVSFYTAKNYLTAHLFEERLNYDAQVFFENVVDAETMQNIRASSEVKAFEEMSYTDAVLHFEGTEEEVLLNAVEQYGSLITLYDTDGKKMPIPQYGIVLEENTAKRLDAQVGDYIKMRFSFAGEEFEEELFVNGIARENAIFTQYCSLTQFKKIVDIPNVTNAIVFELQNEASEIPFGQMIYACDGFSSVAFRRLQEEDVNENFKLFDIGIYLIIAFSLLMGFVLVYNMYLMNLSEREHEYGLLRIFGMTRQELALSALAEELFQLIVSLILAIPLCTYLTPFILSLMDTSSVSYPFVGGAGTYLISLFVMLLFTIVGHYTAATRIKNINLALSIKERD